MSRGIRKSKISRFPKPSFVDHSRRGGDVPAGGSLQPCPRTIPLPAHTHTPPLRVVADRSSTTYHLCRNDSMTQLFTAHCFGERPDILCRAADDSCAVATVLGAAVVSPLDEDSIISDMYSPSIRSARSHPTPAAINSVGERTPARRSGVVFKPCLN